MKKYIITTEMVVYADSKIEALGIYLSEIQEIVAEVEASGDAADDVDTSPIVVVVSEV